MSEENFEEWDADFLDQLIQVEELALSKLPATTPSNTNTNTQSALSSFQQPQLQPPLNVDSFISYSPPRELSQRIPALDSTSHSLHAIFSKSSSSNDNDDVKDLEIQRLKSELGRVSKQLKELERECSQLQKDRNQKQGQIAIAASKNIDKNGVQHLKGKSLCRDCTACPDGVLQQLQNAKAINDQVGPQINIAGPRSNDIGVQVDLSSPLGLTKKLQGIWRSPRDRKLGGNLISKLFSVCSLEFRVLFGFMNLNKSPKVMDCLAVGSCDAALQYHMQSDHNSEAAKVSYLYSVLPKGQCHG